MRIKKTFAVRQRTKSSDTVKKKYFLICEGDATEVQYFEGINSIKEKLGIDMLIDIRPVLRSYNEAGWTNPKKLLDRFIECADDEKDGTLSVELFTDRIVDFLIEDGWFMRSLYPPETIRMIVIAWFENRGVDYEDDIEDLEGTLEKLVSFLKREFKIEKSVDKIKHYLKEQNITYKEGFDRVCLIVDRDRDSFVSHPDNDQFNYVREKCCERDFGFFITNPCFEFWLLLHFDDVFKLDSEVIAANPKITNKLRYLENELRKLVPGYRKSHIRFDCLKNRVLKAVTNEKAFCEDIDGLRDSVGSNIGLLINELRGFA